LVCARNACRSEVCERVPCKSVVGEIRVCKGVVCKSGVYVCVCERVVCESAVGERVVWDRGGYKCCVQALRGKVRVSKNCVKSCVGQKCV